MWKYYENIVIVFLNLNFLFFILCFPYFILFFYPYFLLLFFPRFFSSTHVPLLFFSLFPSFLFFPITSSTLVILRYSRSKENGALSSHIHGEIHSLNSWWGLPWMWEEGVPFHYTSGLPKNFPLHTRALTFFLFFLLSSFSLPLHTLERSTQSWALFLSIFFLPFLLPLRLQVSFLPSIPSKHTNFLGVLLIKTLPSKCISQIRLDINNFFFKNIQRNAR